MDTFVDGLNLGPFYGFDEKDSYVNPDPDKVKAGRCNPYYIPYLYAAESSYTAIVEVRPSLNSYINVAEIEILDDLRIFNIAMKDIITDRTSILRNVLSSRFSRIVNDYQDRQYLATQCITEYIKNLGYDGLKFDSSLDKEGTNVVVFDTAKCKAISSSVHTICGITYSTRRDVPYP